MADRVNTLRHDLTAIYHLRPWSGAELGCVFEDSDGNILFSKHARTRLVPASNNKLFAATYALAVLGPNYRPKTLIWKSGKEVVIESTGDPLLSPQQLDLAAKQLHLNHKEPVKIWEAYRGGWNGDWELGDLPYYYTAQVDALTLDRGAIELDAVHGKPRLMPHSYGNRIVWTERHNPTFVDTYDPWKHTVELTGQLPNPNGRLDRYALPDPDQVAASRLGIFSGYATTPPQGQPSYVITGQRLEKTMRTCLQISDNNIAENLLMLAASQGQRLTDPYDQALQKERAWYKSNLGFDGYDVILDDGSGLSRENSVQPMTIANLLLWHLQQPNAELWRSLLDHPGGGTMTHRLLKYKIQCKTGSMTRVSAISGYLTLRNGQTIIFSLIENNYNCSGQTTKQLEDKILETVERDLSVGT